MTARLRTAVLAVASIAGLVACGDQPSAAPEPDVSDAGSVSASSSVEPSDDPEVPAEPARFDVRLEIPDGPDWLAAGFGSLWVKRDNGAVVRVSPAGEVEATIDADIFEQPVCQGIGVTEEWVWACATGGTLIRIDPATNEIAARVDLPKINEQGRLTSSDALLWVLTGDGDQLEGIADDGQSATRIDLGTYCNEVADTVVDGVLWVACAYEGVALGVDLEAGEVTGRVPELPGATAVSAGDDVWVGYEAGLARIDPDALELVDTIPLGVVGLRVTDEGVLVRGSGDEFLAVVDPDSGVVTARLTAPALTSAGDAIAAHGRWWATAADDNALVRLRP